MDAWGRAAMPPQLELKGLTRLAGDVPIVSSDHAIVILLKGRATIRSAHERFLLVEGDAMQLPCGPNARVEPMQGIGWVLHYAVRVYGDERAAGTAQAVLLPPLRVVKVRPLAALAAAIDKLAACEEPRGETAAMRRQAALLELLALLMDNQARTHQAPEGAQAVEATIAYARRHFTEPLTVEQLAGMAGLGRASYSALFRQLTGDKPLSYLNRLRLNRAKELLLLGDDPLREIARAVGYRDEGYFNRLFRARFGCAPKAYARMHRATSGPGRATAAAWPPAARLAVSGSMLGDVLLLGIQPQCAALRVMGRQVVYRDRLAGIDELEDMCPGEALEPGRPELVLLESEHGRAVGAGIAWDRATRVVAFDRAEDTELRLQTIGTLLDRREAAERWIAAHEAAAQAMWTSVRSRIGSGETASVLVQVGEHLYAMGNQGLAATLYHPRGFVPSGGAQRLIAQRRRFAPVGADELTDYDGDRLFLLVGADAWPHAERLLASASWRELRACRRGVVHLAKAQWNYDDALTRERLVPLLPRMLSAGCDSSRPVPSI
ncbi:AraC family transcriptional regulator [Paenibacillus sp. IB182496]|uniref:AraC family transcriptional regulator n=1 Tax=Paenibacillus sabuli TaxID=2772509 RepID=A0A927BR16_9BACL|nr:AraC family transcriptional regulator [Paenibacillus sabuli]MBD2843908.1 AraC family transcriptional regulator [Paenibacillus sabuli]